MKKQKPENPAAEGAVAGATAVSGEDERGSVASRWWGSEPDAAHGGGAEGPGAELRRGPRKSVRGTACLSWG